MIEGLMLFHHQAENIVTGTQEGSFKGYPIFCIKRNKLLYQFCSNSELTNIVKSMRFILRNTSYISTLKFICFYLNDN